MNSSNITSARKKVVQELFEAYEKYKREEILSRRFNQARMLEWFQPLLEEELVRAIPLGRSAEGRIVSLYSYGRGSKRVLLWSQMHGDEPTATMALMDMLNFFRKYQGHSLVKSIHDRLTLQMIPMLNPDGAERFTRRTAQLIDMNRDAVALVTPEANILKNAQRAYRPQFGFNLHDQDPRLSVGSTKNVTAVALLAPAMNEERRDNDVRLRAKKVASVFAEVLGQLVQGHVAKYDDAFDARAFGDSVQSWGTSTVLVESGGWPKDRDKMFIRRLNVVGLLATLDAIASGEVERQDIGAYESLPFNTKNVYDVIFRNVQVQAEANTPPVKADVAFNVEEVHHGGNELRLVGRVMDVGDLGRYGAFEEFEAGSKMVSGREIPLDQAIPWERVELLLK